MDRAPGDPLEKSENFARREFHREALGYKAGGTGRQVPGDPGYSGRGTFFLEGAAPFSSFGAEQKNAKVPQWSA
jgi:hypothetical protein